MEGVPHATVLADRLRRPGTVLLDAPRPDADTGRRGALLFSDPARVLMASRPTEVQPLLDDLDAALEDGHHVAGYVSYEAGYALEPTRFRNPQQEPDVPLAWFGVYEAPVRFDLEAVEAVLPPPATIGPARFAFDKADYRTALEAVKAHIRAGDVYQINLTAPLRFDLEDEPLALFARLRARQQASYGAWIAGDVSVASVSPELFFRIDPIEGGRRITTRPMKGTAPRGTSRASDDELRQTLQGDEKNRAENLMIVDLLRNDLSRVAEVGSVRVPALFEAERYETVTQMTSTVTAKLRPEVGLGGVMQALFPCGSITGAPKLRAMGIIRDLEVGPRGVYCGAIGYAAPDGTAAFNVAIRTAVVAGGQARYDVGSGVVWDSDPDSEYDECLLKARVLTDPL